MAKPIPEMPSSVFVALVGRPNMRGAEAFMNI